MVGWAVQQRPLEGVEGIVGNAGLRCEQEEVRLGGADGSIAQEALAQGVGGFARTRANPDEPTTANRAEALHDAAPFGSHHRVLCRGGYALVEADEQPPLCGWWRGLGGRRSEQHAYEKREDEGGHDG
jgi:hypothetical protein